jgi:hypothetical protein
MCGPRREAQPKLHKIKSIQDLIQAFRNDKDAFLGTRTPASVTDQLDQVGKWPPGRVLLLMIENQSARALCNSAAATMTAL